MVLYRHSRIRICSAHGTLAICLDSLKLIKQGVKECSGQKSVHELVNVNES